MTLHQKLERLTRDMNKAAVARRVGLKATTISDYLRYRWMPRADIAFKFAIALGVSADWLLDDAKGWPPERLERPDVAPPKVA